jgi:hypothetical protein
VNGYKDGNVTKIVGERKGFDPNSPMTRFTAGDCVTVDVWNLSTHEAVYVSILDLGPKGSISPLFPPKGAPRRRSTPRPRSRRASGGSESRTSSSGSSRRWGRRCSR